jgi:hypothetical protein
MNKQLVYSILQYKHSPVLREAINVGILFFFPEESKKIRFHFTDASRIRPIYKDFDVRYFNAILKIIQSNIEKNADDIYATSLQLSNFRKFINDYVLREDDSALQFSDIQYAINSLTSPEKAVEAYTHLLLPLSGKKGQEILKRDEKVIIKKFRTRLLSIKPELEGHLKKDVEISTEEVSLKFEYAWKNGTLNLVHPLSFDLQDKHAIQKKTAEFCSYLNWLGNLTHTKNYRIDLLLSEPQHNELQNAYQNSLKLLNKSESNKRLIAFEDIDSYVDSAAEYLLHDGTPN